MMMMAESLDEIEKTFGVKCLHNEIKVILYLNKFGPSPSLSIQQFLNRSISGHNSDFKRLRSLGLIDYYVGKEDKRERFYFLTDRGKDLFSIDQFFIEHDDVIQADHKSSVNFQ